MQSVIKLYSGGIFMKIGSVGQTANVAQPAFKGVPAQQANQKQEAQATPSFKGSFGAGDLLKAVVSAFKK